jgi:hypothetical protein
LLCKCEALCSTSPSPSQKKKKPFKNTQMFHFLGHMLIFLVFLLLIILLFGPTFCVIPELFFHSYFYFLQVLSCSVVPFINSALLLLHGCNATSPLSGHGSYFF